MPAEIARSALGRRSGCPEVTVAVRTSLLSCRKAGKPRISKPVRESSGESRVNLAATSAPAGAWPSEPFECAQKATRQGQA
jgi:hypothetical protein